MGRGNFYYEDGFVVYVNLKLYETVEKIIKEEKKFDKNYSNKEKLLDTYNEILHEDLIEDLKYIANKNAKKEKYYEIDEYDHYNEIWYFLEHKNELLKIGVTDNGYYTAICFTPKRRRYDNGFNQNAIKMIQKFIKELLNYYELYFRCGPWLVGKIENEADIYNIF